MSEDSNRLEGWENNDDSTAGLKKDASELMIKPEKNTSAVPPVTFDTSVLDQSELINVRESIFDASGVPNANKIPDWSFVDASALGPAAKGESSKPTKNTASSSKKNLNKL